MSGASSSCQTGVLTRLLSVAGHVALRQLVLLDCDMFNELKRRHALQETDAGRKQEAAAKEKRAANRRKSGKVSDAVAGGIKNRMGVRGCESCGCKMLEYQIFTQEVT